MARIRYFNVPVTSRTINSRDVSLFNMLKVVDEELYEREKARVEMTCDKAISSDRVQIHNETTSRLFNERQLPERLILVQDSFGIMELQTGVIFECDFESYLKVFEIDGMAVVDFFADDEHYCDKADNFINNYYLNKRKKPKGEKVLSKTGKKFDV